MPSYPQDKKAEVLAMMERDGVTKTFEATHIARGTLYKWRNEAAQTNVENKPTTSKAARKKKAKAAPAISESSVMNIAPDMAAIKAALSVDDGLREKVRALEAENALLREKCATLKRMLLTVVDS